MNADASERTSNCVEQISHTNPEYLHSDLTDKILGAFYDVYKELGFGFLESVCEAALCRAIRDLGLAVDTQVPTPVWFRGECIADFRADMVVNGKVLIELKSARTIDSTHEAQLLDYLRATPIEVGLILNFGPRPQMRRMAFSNDRKGISVHQR
jgi:GxxExxY protein